MYRIEISYNTNFQWDIVTRDQFVACDLPQNLGGDNEGPSPEELFLSGIGGGAAITVSRFLKEQNLQGCDEFKIIVQAETGAGPNRISSISTLVVFPPKFPKAMKSKLLDKIGKNPLNATMLMPPDVSVDELEL
ncbi:MAG: OsmC family protein [Candidatus Wallbacteria bacterium]|nr:OsmC family protein [Candidatus Wallbacteria bacterium]